MELLLQILTITGILQAAYGSYLGLTKTLRDDNGLTNFGKKARNSIIIGCAISVSSFIIKENIEPKPDETENLIKYPLDNFEGESTHSVDARQFKSEYLDKTLPLFYKLKKKKNIEGNIKYANTELSITCDTPTTFKNLLVKFDNKGYLKYVVIPQYVLETTNYKWILDLMKLNDTEVYFTKEERIIEKGKVNFSKDTFNLVYRANYKEFKEILYNVKLKRLEITISYDITLDKNNGGIDNLIELANAYCLVQGKPDYFGFLTTKQKKIKFEASIISNQIKGEYIPETDWRDFGLPKEKGHYPKYYVVKYTSKENKKSLEN